MGDIKYTEEEKLKAAYTLNMCTVSVSQILDYNDVFVLEQEYDSILNNLNLEVICKDPALLRILQQILNVISFFRIQKIQREQNEKEYQQRIKNAIWHAIPSFSTVIATVGSNTTNLAMMGLNLATQIGSSYMNYRREKANALRDKEKVDVELEIAAIEQLHALQRELFTTSWLLADEYNYPEKWRLTEKQIEQYNSILMDTDDYRKYARLDAIKDNFEAYPPFWYNFAHTALYIASNIKSNSDDNVVKEKYLKSARASFIKFQEKSKYNILREDQLTASANLEYADLLFLDPNPDYANIHSLISDAEKKAGNANDVLQLCALAYLRANDPENASRLLYNLVNEGYNTTTNAKLLSHLYVNQYLSVKGNYAQVNTVKSQYNVLKTRVNPYYLFPMPTTSADEHESVLEAKYIDNQKELLKIMYCDTINAFANQNAMRFNAVLPAPFNNNIDPQDKYWSQSRKAKERRLKDVKNALTGKYADKYITTLRDCGFRYGYIDVLNNVFSGMEELSCFRNLINHDALIMLIKGQLEIAKAPLYNRQKKLDDGTFAFSDYQSLVTTCSFKVFTEDFFNKVKTDIVSFIDKESSLDNIEDLFSDLETFCDAHHLPSPDTYIPKNEELSTVVNEPQISHDKVFFEYDVLIDSGNSYDVVDLRNKMLDTINNLLSDLVIDPKRARVYARGDQEFNAYLNNGYLKVSDISIFELRQKSIAIIDDVTIFDKDLILTVDGVRLVQRNHVRDCIDFNDVKYNTAANNSKLTLGYTGDFSLKSVKLDVLNEIITKLGQCYTEANAK